MVKSQFFGELGFNGPYCAPIPTNPNPSNPNPIAIFAQLLRLAVLSILIFPQLKSTPDFSPANPSAASSAPLTRKVLATTAAKTRKCMILNDKESRAARANRAVTFFPTEKTDMIR